MSTDSSHPPRDDARLELAGNEIAIVGMAARFPGARSAAEFWRNVRDGVESVSAMSDEELLAAGVPAATLRDPRYVKSSVVLEDMEMFDAEFFGFSPKEAAIMDPQHRHFLECVWEALENAGHRPESFGGPIGVFAGCGMGAYFAFNLLTNRALCESVGLFLLRHTGNDKDFLATRASYCFNLTGPSINVQTACSTSLVAVHMASQSLLSGECDMALAGGVTIEIPHRQGYLYHEGEILSPDGHCRAFDHRSEGTIFGSGAGVVVLRRLQDALDDGDQIVAVIKGSAVNNDGASKVGYLAPSVDGQAAAMTEALAVAGVEANTIELVECHGTGTRMGDPIEVAALAQAFRRSNPRGGRTGVCGIGSVKTNIGHLDTAAGVASLMKAALALRHRQLPPSLNYEAPNPQIDFAASPFYVNDRLRDWRPSSHPRRAAVNSLGVGGTNAHAILEEAPEPSVATRSAAPCQLLTLSARNRAALDDATRRLVGHLRDHSEVPLDDVAWTLAIGRRAFDERRVVAVANRDEAIALLESGDSTRVFTHKAQSDKPSIVFMFPGGGVQYFGMATDLYRTKAVFREHVDRGLAALRPLVDFDLRDLLFADESRRAEVDRVMERPAVQLPAIFIIEFALAKLWESRGVEPAALIGHSLGENTAACVAGVLSFEEALGLVKLRGELFERLPEGGMLSVPLAEMDLRPLLGGDLDLATVNSPGFCTASGPSAALERLERTLSERGIEGKRIPISIAAHSRMLEPILADFGDYLRRCMLRPPKIPFVSNRTGTWITEAEATDPDYWVQHLRQTIHFAAGIGTLLETPGRIFLEVGPGKALGSLARQHAAMKPSQVVVSSLRHGQEKTSDTAYFTTTFGRLWAAGAPVDLARLWNGERRRRVPLPTYPFQHQRYWIEPGKQEAPVPASPPLERLASVDDWFFVPKWQEQSIDALASADSLRAKGEAAQAVTPGAWLVFADEAGVGDLLVERLRSAGQEVIRVREGDAYARISADEFRLSPERGRDDYAALVRDLVSSGKTPGRIVHLWLLTADESFRPGSSFFHRNQERGFYSLLFLAQALGGEGLAGPRHIAVAANGLCQVADEGLPYPGKATVFGPVKVIPRELAGVTCSLVDVRLGEDDRSANARSRSHGGQSAHRRHGLREAAASAANELLSEIVGTPHNEIAAWRHGRRYRRTFEKRSLPSPARGSVAIRRGGTYLITGGLGGVGMVVAEHLAHQGAGRLVLLGRTELPPRHTWNRYLAEHSADDAIAERMRRVRALEAAGAEVLVVAADVTDIDTMQSAIDDVRQRFGAIHGVVHAAGVLRDGLLQTKTQSQAEDVFAPKVHGTLVLDELLSAEPLDFFVAFSSTSAVTAPAGQVDYVAANAFLNHFAHSRQATTQRGRKPNARPWKQVVALAWGVWDEVGMAAETLRRFASTAPNVAEAAKPATVAVEHPLFDARTGGTHDRQTVFTARLSPAEQWVLDEHRTAEGHAVLPGTAYLELVRAALAETGASGPFALRDLFFVRPLHVADGASRDMRLRLTPSAAGYSFDVQSRIAGDDGRMGWATHAQGQALLGESQGDKRIDLAALDLRCQRDRRVGTHQQLRTRQEDHLRFGPRWHVLRSVAFGEREAIARLELPERFIADVEQFGLHPALVDLATGFAMRLIGGYDDREGAASDLWVPVSYRQVRVYGPLPARIVSHVRGDAANRVDAKFASFDVTIANERGDVLVEVEGFSIAHVAAGADFSAARPPRAADLEFDAQRGASLSAALSPAQRALADYVSLGIRPVEGMQAFDRVLADASLAEIVVSSVDLGALVRQANEAAGAKESDDAARFARPELASEFLGPRDDVERTLVGFFQELLGVEQVGIRDSFFELGGHSLIAVRLFAKIKQAYRAEFPISVLFEAPTVEACAALIKGTVGLDAAAGEGDGASTAASREPQRRYLHLVAMHEGEGGVKTPFFLVAGMFGNVLNLRHLAHLVGADRPCYGLQARGLFGELPPHATFEEAAADYLKEIRTIQPHGPYLLGGFSGGGISAYEMAQQLIADGEGVALLVLLDTPLPFDEPLSLRDKLVMHAQKFARDKHRYVTERVRSRVAWTLEQRRKRQAPGESPMAEANLAAFQSSLMEQAFRAALDRYSLRPYPGVVTLFRPKLNPEHVLGVGRMINQDRRFIFSDNGWTPYVARVDVVEVPGNHDSMVLEPNVRVLGARLRRAIEQAERARSQSTAASADGDDCSEQDDNRFATAAGAGI